MSLRDRLRWSVRLTTTRDPLAELKLSLEAGYARQRIARLARREAALRGMGR